MKENAVGAAVDKWKFCGGNRAVTLAVQNAKKYSISLIAPSGVTHLHIIQPQREGDGRQALVVPPLYPAPAASLIPVLAKLFNTTAQSF